jgi:hypothetical protein
MAAKLKRRTETRDIGPLAFRAAFAPDTIDIEKRTVRVTWTTGARVMRGFWDRFLEELSLDDGHVRMGRLQGRAPLLNAHNAFDCAAVIGRVENAEISDGQGSALVRFGSDSDSEKIFSKVREGILQDVSVGYRVHKYEDAGVLGGGDDQGDAIPIRRAVDWEPFELSMVPIGADAGAGVRSAGVETNRCELVTRAPEEKATMAKTKKRTATGTPAATPAVRAEVKDPPEETEDETPEETEDDEVEAEGDAEESAETTKASGRSGTLLSAEKMLERARIEERTRISSIQRTAARMGVEDPTLVKRAIDDGTSVAAFVKLALRKLDEVEPVIDPAGRVRVDGVRGGDERDKFRKSAVDHLLVRAGLADMLVAAAKKRGETLVLDDGAVRGMTTLRLAEECLMRAGVKTRGLGPLEMAGKAFEVRAGGYQTTSDFPVLLDEAVNRTLLASYELAEDEWRKLAKVGSASDFRPASLLRLGSMGRLDKVPEHAEFKNKPILEGEAEQVQVETFGNMFAITRQVIINDQLGAILDFVARIGEMAGVTIEEEFWDLLLSNAGLGPDMADGQPLFDAAHNNIGTGAALEVAGLDADRQLMAAQTDFSGRRIVMRPKVLVVGTTEGMLARQLNTAEFDMDVGDGATPSGIRGLFDLIIDTPRITAPVRYMFADPMRNPTFQVTFLNGQQTPFTESRDGWRIDGKEYKVRHDFGVDAIDYRTALYNDGVP